MITELILSGFFGIADIFLGLLPGADWTVDTGAWSAVADVLSMICYLLPLGAIQSIISTIIAISVFRLTVSILHSVLKLIPFFG